MENLRHYRDMPPPSEDEQAVSRVVLGRCLHPRRTTFGEYGQWRSVCSDCGESILLAQSEHAPNISEDELAALWLKETPRTAQMAETGELVVRLLERQGWSVSFGTGEGGTFCWLRMPLQGIRSAKRQTRAQAVTDVAAQAIRAGILR